MASSFSGDFVFLETNVFTTGSVHLVLVPTKRTVYPSSGDQ